MQPIPPNTTTYINILQAINYFTDAWNNDLEPRTIAHGFQKTGLFPTMLSLDINENAEPGSLNMPGFEPISAEAYVDIDAKEDTEEVKTELDIVTEVIEAAGIGSRPPGVEVGSVGASRAEGEEYPAVLLLSGDKQVGEDRGVEDELCEQLQATSISQKTGPSTRQRRMFSVVTPDSWTSYY